MYDDTIAAVATPPGEGGIGVIRLSGKDSESGGVIMRIGLRNADAYPSSTKISPFDSLRPITAITRSALRIASLVNSSKEPPTGPRSAIVIGLIGERMYEMLVLGCELSLAFVKHLEYANDVLL